VNSRQLQRGLLRTGRKIRAPEDECSARQAAILPDETTVMILHTVP
jgi:hypothetical protein